MLTLKTTATFLSVEEFFREKGKFISFVYLTDFQREGEREKIIHLRGMYLNLFPKLPWWLRG